MNGERIFVAIGFIFIFGFWMLCLGSCLGRQMGMQMEACKPYTRIESIDGDRVVCEMPDGGIEIRKY